MPELPPVVVDTNIVFSALLSRSSTFADLLLTSNYRFYVCELVVVELFKQKDKLIRASRLSEDEIVRVLYTLLRHLHLYKEDLIAPENRRAA
jgi:predicted nucleic acid-binding protein